MAKLSRGALVPTILCYNTKSMSCFIIPIRGGGLAVIKRSEKHILPRHDDMFSLKHPDFSSAELEVAHDVRLRLVQSYIDLLRDEFGLQL